MALPPDRAVIAHLPDKIKVKAFCSLTKRQAALYQESVESLAREIASHGLSSCQTHERTRGRLRRQASACPSGRASTIALKCSSRRPHQACFTMSHE